MMRGMSSDRDLQEPQPIALFERSYRADPGFHSHGYFQLILPRHGDMLLRVDGGRLALGAASWVLLPPNVYHVYWAERPNRMLVANLAARALATAAEALGVVQAAPRDGEALLRPADGRIAALAELLRSELQADALAEPLLAEQLAAYVDASLAVALRPARRTAQRRPGERVAARARDFLEANACAPVSLAEVAAVAGVSVAHLQRSFRAAHGVSVVEYLQGLRLRRAQELLRTSDLPVEAVAAAVGFASASYFSRLFTRELGVSPARFRRR